MLVDLDDIRVNVIDEGEGQAVVFLHGLGANHRIWTLQLDAFHGKYRCIAPDLRGSGQSDHPPGPYSTELLADDVARLCERLGVERAVIVGQSMGGAVAQALAVHHRGLVQALVLIGTACDGRYGRGWPGLSELISALRERGFQAVLPEVIDGIYPKAFQEAHPELVWHFERELYSFDLDAFIAALERDCNTDYRTELTKLDVPTLVVVGRHDALSPVAESEYLVELIPGSELLIVEHCGHQPFYEDPAGFNALLRDFIARPEVRARASSELHA